MSARPKLVQEGAPLEGSRGTSSLQAAKPKYRLVIGGDDEPLPDDPDQNHDYKKYEYRGSSLRGRSYGGRGRGRGGRYNNYGRGGRGYDSYRGGGYNRDGYGRDNYGGGRGGYSGGYGGGGYDNRYDNRYDYDGGYDDRGYDNNHHHHHGGGHHHYNDGGGGGYMGKKIIKNPKAPGLVTGRIVIGGGEEDAEHPEEPNATHMVQSMDVEEIIPQTYNEELHQIERMEGVVSLDAAEPLVVMDGANVAYAYADAMAAVSSGGKREPDYRGLQVAAHYFLSAGIRVLIVLPAPWFRVKAAAGDMNRENALMLTEKVEALKEMKDQGLLVASPPRDDDDAYALTIARRERTRSMERGSGGGFVLSNDMFRDAMARDADLEQWLQREWGRISFAFCDLGTLNDYGQKELDFIPNPRHPMVSDVERQRHAPVEDA